MFYSYNTIVQHNYYYVILLFECSAPDSFEELRNSLLFSIGSKPRGDCKLVSRRRLLCFAGNWISNSSPFLKAKKSNYFVMKSDGRKWKQTFFFCHKHLLNGIQISSASAQLFEKSHKTHYFKSFTTFFSLPRSFVANKNLNNYLRSKALLMIILIKTEFNPGKPRCFKITTKQWPLKQ